MLLGCLFLEFSTHVEEIHAVYREKLNLQTTLLAELTSDSTTNLLGGEYAFLKVSPQYLSQPVLAVAWNKSEPIDLFLICKENK